MEFDDKTKPVTPVTQKEATEIGGPEGQAASVGSEAEILQRIWAEGIRGAEGLPSTGEMLGAMVFDGDPHTNLDTLMRIRGNEYREYEFWELSAEINPHLGSLNPSQLVSQFEDLYRALIEGPSALTAYGSDPAYHEQLRKSARAKAR